MSDAMSLKSHTGVSQNEKQAARLPTSFFQRIHRRL